MDETAIALRAATHPLLAVLEPRVLDTLLRASRILRCRANRILLREGERATEVFCLLEGSARLFHRSPQGIELSIELLRAPASFGEREVLATMPVLAYAATLETSLLLGVPSRVFHKLVQTQRAFTEALVADMAARLCVATHNERNLAFCDVDTRLANLLLDYAELFGEPEGSGIHIDLRLTQDRMARDLAVSRKSLVRSLAKLLERGLITKRKGRYTIQELPRLKQAGSGTLGLCYDSRGLGPETDPLIPLPPSAQVRQKAN